MRLFFVRLSNCFTPTFTPVTMFKRFLANAEGLPLRANQLIDIPNGGGVKTIALNYDSVTNDSQLVRLFKQYHAIIFLLKVKGQHVGHFTVLRKFGSKFFWFDPYGLGFEDIDIAHEKHFVMRWVKKHPFQISRARLQKSWSEDESWVAFFRFGSGCGTGVSGFFRFLNPYFLCKSFDALLLRFDFQRPLS